jgi:phosphopantothenoylcysteine decarboxylase/phosphopantothenate--cysteine ligase
VGDDCGFDRDDNAVELIWSDGEQELPNAAKTELAEQIVQIIATRYETTRGSGKPQDIHAIH